MIASLTAVGSRGEDLDPARFRRLIPAASGSTDNGVSTLTISNAELVPVPEPAIWLTALAGLGLPAPAPGPVLVCLAAHETVETLEAPLSGLKRKS